MDSLQLPASINELNVVNSRIEEILKDSQEYIFKTELVVEELLTNIAKYAYKANDSNKYLNFVCGYVYFDGKKSILLQFTYGGVDFDPFYNIYEVDTSLPMEEREIGGLGLHLVKEISTHYTYARIDNYNQIQLYLALDDKED